MLNPTTSSHMLMEFFASIAILFEGMKERRRENGHETHTERERGGGEENGRVEAERETNGTR